MTTAENIQSLRNSLVESGEDPEKFFPSCIGCGYCCLQSTCSLGIHLWGIEQPCFGLYWDGERYRCRLAIDFAEKLYIGCVCCSPKNHQRDIMKKSFKLKNTKGGKNQ